MNSNDLVTYSTGDSRLSKHWTTVSRPWAALIERLKTPHISDETLEEYYSMSKAKQDQLKDIGGFVGGVLKDGRRRAGHVTSRSLGCLDLDDCPAESANAIIGAIQEQGHAFAVYSTRKHSPGAPRLRVVIPFSRPVSAAEYQAVMRKYAASADVLKYCDPTTFEAQRLMYWPSRCSDGEFIFRQSADDAKWLNVDGILSHYVSKGEDIAEWPRAPKETKAITRDIKSQTDPETKAGIVGAFCRVYNVPAAIDTFLSDVYEPTGFADRYTYTIESTTFGGAVVYENGKFLKSWHAHDPCNGPHVYNAFDLVRVHKFGHLDEDSDELSGNRGNNLPSYQAMRKFAVSDEMPDDRVSNLHLKEMFGGVDTDESDSSEGKLLADVNDWVGMLERNENGRAKPTAANVLIILDNAPEFVGKLAYNEFTGKREVLGCLPWVKAGTEDEKVPREWGDTDLDGAYIHMEKKYKIDRRPAIVSAVAVHFRQHGYNPITEYLNGLTWDGIGRLDTLWIDYMGAADTPLVRAMARKALCAAVARAFDPGVKFDYMTILSGPQGCGKSTMLIKLGGDGKWHTDSFLSFDGKDAYEMVRNKWIIEIGELTAYSRADAAKVKQFLSTQSDTYRASYGRYTNDIPRRCVFFGTTNDDEYLRDETGNRRFWPVECLVQSRWKSPWSDLPAEVDQIWAEAVTRWRDGEPLILPPELDSAVVAVQAEHAESDVTAGLVLEYLSQPIPEDWYEKDYSEYENFDTRKTVQRDRVTALEVWRYGLKMGGRPPKYESTHINRIIKSTGEWEKRTGRFGRFGLQKGFTKPGV
jgi:predicted P-loop ATPase